jgi:hypothetical protein
MKTNKSTTDGSREKTHHDAEMSYRDTRQGKIVVWSWTDGRKTVTPDEHKVIREYTKKAENRLDFSLLESGETVAYVWMTDDEQLDSIEWCDND